MDISDAPDQSYCIGSVWYQESHSVPHVISPPHPLPLGKQHHASLHLSIWKWSVICPFYGHPQPQLPATSSTFVVVLGSYFQMSSHTPDPFLLLPSVTFLFVHLRISFFAPLLSCPIWMCPCGGGGCEEEEEGSMLCEIQSDNNYNYWCNVRHKQSKHFVVVVVRFGFHSSLMCLVVHLYTQPQCDYWWGLFMACRMAVIFFSLFSCSILL